MGRTASRMEAPAKRWFAVSHPSHSGHQKLTFIHHNFVASRSPREDRCSMKSASPKRSLTPSVEPTPTPSPLPQQSQGKKAATTVLATPRTMRQQRKPTWQSQRVEETVEASETSHASAQHEPCIAHNRNIDGQALAMMTGVGTQQRAQG